MYLEAELAADTVTNATATTTTATTPTNGTSRRLSTIELTMIAGVTISALSLVINIYNTMRRARAA